MKEYHVSVVGGTGAVGQELLRLFEKRGFPVASLRCFGSSRSEGTRIPFDTGTVLVENLATTDFSGSDIIFFCAKSSVSATYVPIALRSGAVVIDNSSAFRQNPSVPLVIPEVNPETLLDHKQLIANPNCATILLLTVLAPLHKAARLKRVVVSTYQAASGAGLQAMEDLREETRAFLQGTTYSRLSVPHPYAFNLFLHNSPLNREGYSEEEIKIREETRKILQDPSLKIAATCVRVPVLRSHAEAVNAEFYHPLSPEEAYRILKNAPGVSMSEDRISNRFPMPIDATGQDVVLYGRIRNDLSQDNTLDLWIVGDQLLKGAALNAIQIAETLFGISPRTNRCKEVVSAIC